MGVAQECGRVLRSDGVISLPLPTRILVHGYVTVEGRKIGKSTGNAVDPVPLAEELGSDTLRYFLLRHIRSTGDGDFSHRRLRQAYESELAGQLGNLVHRVLSMIERYCDRTTPAPPEGFAEVDRLLRMAKQLPDNVAAHLHAFAFDRALDEIWTLVADANRYVAEELRGIWPKLQLRMIAEWLRQAQPSCPAYCSAYQRLS